jgi:curved DNA-binding protein CbpA
MRARVAVRPMDEIEARQLLGVGLNANADEINAAHRRLIAQVHPDRGGTAELARRVNAARDLLLGQVKADG